MEHQQRDSGWSLILRKAKLWHRFRDDYEPLSTKVSDIGRAVSREELRIFTIIHPGVFTIIHPSPGFCF
jgi:hypothetical protein